MQYRYSYSGADCKVYICPHGEYSKFIEFEGFNTISYSIHEAKGQARALGYRGVKGFSRGIRTIAGSFILTVIEDNPFRPFLKLLQEPGESIPAVDKRQYGYSADMGLTGTGAFNDDFDFANALPTIMYPFDLLLIYATERPFEARTDTIWREEGMWRRKTEDQGLEAAYASSLIEAIEIVDNGVVTSINDSVTEMTCSFMARNVMPMTLVLPRKTIFLNDDERPTIPIPVNLAGSTEEPE